MADVASLLAEFQKGIEGKDTGLGATVKFDFEGAGCIFLDGKSNPNTVSELVLPKSTTEFSLEFVRRSMSLANNVGTILLGSTTAGSPSRRILAISLNRLNLPELSTYATVTPNEIGEIALL